MRDFCERVALSLNEVQNRIRVGAFDCFHEPRTAQFWQLQYLAQWPRAQGWLFRSEENAPLPVVPLTEPDYAQRLRDETELLGFTVSGNPLDQFPDVAWKTYCAIDGLDKFPNQQVTVCGLIIQDRMHSQSTGETMKFITVCDYSGIVECEIFADAYRRFGLATVRYPVVEISGTVQLFDNGIGCTLQAVRIGKPRTNRATSRSTARDGALTSR